jgi:hypothetical protein
MWLGQQKKNQRKKWNRSIYPRDHLPKILFFVCGIEERKEDAKRMIKTYHRFLFPGFRPKRIGMRKL